MESLHPDRKVTSYEVFLKLVQWFKYFEDFDQHSDEFFEELYHKAFGFEKIVEGSYQKNCELFVTEPYKIKKLYNEAKDDLFWKKMYQTAFKDRKLSESGSWEDNYQKAFREERI